MAEGVGCRELSAVFQGSEFIPIEGLGFRVWDSGLRRVLGCGLRVFRVNGTGVYEFGV